MSDVNLCIGLCVFSVAVVSASCWIFGSKGNSTDQSSCTLDYKVYERYDGTTLYRLHAKRLYAHTVPYGYTAGATLELFVLKDSGKYAVYWAHRGSYRVTTHSSLQAAKDHMRQLIEAPVHTVAIALKRGLMSHQLYADDTQELS